MPTKTSNPCFKPQKGLLDGPVMPKVVATRTACPCVGDPQLIARGFSQLSYHHLLLEAPQHLLQLQLVLAVQLGLVPVLLLLQQTQLPQLLAPAEGQGGPGGWRNARSGRVREGRDGQIHTQSVSAAPPSHSTL